jgi:hypothetical protein
MFFEVADDRLDGGAPFELALDLRRDAALFARNTPLILGQKKGALQQRTPSDKLGGTSVIPAN